MLLLFDIGGTKTRVAVTSSAETKIDSNKVKIFPTSNLFSDGVEQIAQVALYLANGNKFQIGGGGIGALLNESKTGIINYAKKPTLADWEGKPLVTKLEQALDCTIHLENDAALGGLGEAVFGAGKNNSLIAYLTIGTGVGGVKIENGMIAKNHFGFEPGKQLLKVNDHQSVSLERLIGGRFIEEKTHTTPSEIKESTFWKEIEYYLALGLHNTALFWSPEKIVLGGSIVNYLSLEEITNQFNELLADFPQKPLIKKATLGELSGLYGALHHLKNLNNH